MFPPRFVTVGLLLYISCFEACITTNTQILSHCSFTFEKYKRLIVLRSDSAFRHLSMWAIHSQHSRGFQSSDIQLLAPGKIYSFQLTDEKLLVPVPFLITCPEHHDPLHVSTCEFSFDSNNYESSQSSIGSAISKKNFTGLGAAPALFLDEGTTTISRCQIIDCETGRKYITDSNDRFTFDVHFEKPIHSECHSTEDCGPKQLYSCNDQKCACRKHKQYSLDRNTYCKAIVPFDIYNPICDSLDICTNDPDKCIVWCNMTSTADCICPFGSQKIRMFSDVESDAGIFSCEILEGYPCDSEHTQCEYGTICLKGKCSQNLVNGSTDMNVLRRSNLLRSRSPDRSDIKNPKSNIIMKAYLFAISTTLLAIMCVLTAAVAKLKSARKKFRESSRPSVFLPIDGGIAPANNECRKTDILDENYGKFNLIHSGYIGPYQQFKRDTSICSPKNTHSCTVGIHRFSPVCRSPMLKNSIENCHKEHLFSPSITESSKMYKWYKPCKTNENKSTQDEGYFTGEDHNKELLQFSPVGNISDFSTPSIQQLSNGDVVISA